MKALKKNNWVKRAICKLLIASTLHTSIVVEPTTITSKLALKINVKICLLNGITMFSKLTIST